MLNHSKLGLNSQVVMCICVLSCNDVQSYDPHECSQKMCLQPGWGRSGGSRWQLPQTCSSPRCSSPPVPAPASCSLLGFPSRTNTWCIWDLGRLGVVGMETVAAAAKGRGLREDQKRPRETGNFQFLNLWWDQNVKPAQSRGFLKICWGKRETRHPFSNSHGCDL